MKTAMPEWINHTHASYVLVAYLIAAVALIGLAASTWRSYRQRQREWAELSKPRPNDVR